MERLPLSLGIILVCLGLSHSECPHGWFGSSCQYKCRCTEDKCEPLVGNCLEGAQCLQGWFGPACQYVDLAQYSAIMNQFQLATDGNDTTCMSADFLGVQLRVPLQLSWFRVHVKDPYYMDKLKIQFKQQNNSLIDCENNRTALVSDTALDIHCDLDIKVTQVILTGETVQALCSFYISGGRNVALRQKTSQSSLYDTQSHASNAVDGDRTNWFAKGSCTHTAFIDREPIWNLTFSHPAAVNRFIIYNRNEGLYMDQRLQGFILRGYDPAGAEVFFFNDITQTEQEVYTVTSVATEIQTVSIRAVKPSNDGNIVLTLCEVEVYGDFVCEPGQYGRDCEHKCNCADSKDTCFVSTGGCPSGCKSGYKGEDCSQVTPGPITDNITTTDINTTTGITTTPVIITTTNIITETSLPANQTASTTTPPPARHDFKCHRTYIQVYIPVDVVPNSVLTLRDPSCKLTNNGTHHTISFPYSECGTSEISYANYFNAENEISVHLTLNETSDITFVEDYTIPLRCTVVRTKSLIGAIQVLPREGIAENIVESSEFYMKEFTTAEYNVEITEYPVKVPLNRQIFFELVVKNTTNSNTGLLVEKCDATPTPNPDDTTSVSLIRKGCSVNPAVKVQPSVGKDSFRFSTQAFHFSGSANNNNLVYVHCSVGTCNSVCDITCPPRARRRRRSAGQRLSFATLTSGSHVATNEGK